MPSFLDKNHTKLDTYIVETGELIAEYCASKLIYTASDVGSVLVLSVPLVGSAEAALDSSGRRGSL